MLVCVVSIAFVELTPLHERIHAAVGGRTYRAIAELTGSNAETVRRYMMGQAPSAEFLAALCQAIGLNAQWLLTGRGPMKASHIKAHALSEASAAELLSAMARTLERLTDRVERLEVFVTTLEAKLRGIHALLANDDRRRMTDAGDGASYESGFQPSSTRPASPERDNSPTGRQSPGDEVRIRADGIADALAPRPRPDAR